MSADRRVEKLRPGHRIEDFDCGREELNRYGPGSIVLFDKIGRSHREPGRHPRSRVHEEEWHRLRAPKAEGECAVGERSVLLEQEGESLEELSRGANSQAGSLCDSFGKMFCIVGKQPIRVAIHCR